MKIPFFMLAATIAFGQPELQFVGSAHRVGSIMRLTSAERQTMGAVWAVDRQPVGSAFDTEFQFQLTKPGGLGRGADGFAFVLQNSGPDAIGGRGASGGFALGDGWGRPDRSGIPNSIAVFFDTFRNGDAQDPSDNYIAICTNGTVRDMRWPPPRLGVAAKLKTRMKDEKIHSVRIEYRKPVMAVFLDDMENPVLTAAVDLSTVLDRTGRAWVGFTASTGSGFENHDILNWSFRTPEVSSDISTVSSTISYELVDCMPGRNLCTPAAAVVEETSPGRYRVVLPGHREWGAGVPLAPGKEAVIADARGVVCWDLESRGAKGCTGPAGEGSGSNAGALIMRMKDGVAQFSVNDRSFADNQGYFEFDVIVR